MIKSNYLYKILFLLDKMLLQVLTTYHKIVLLIVTFMSDKNYAKKLAMENPKTLLFLDPRT